MMQANLQREGTRAPIFVNASLHIYPYPIISPPRSAHSNLLSRHNAPSPNQVIRVPSEQCLPIGTPCQADALRLPALLAYSGILRLQLVDLALLLQVKDDDRAGGGGAEPVSVGRENEGVDFVTGG